MPPEALNFDDIKYTINRMEAMDVKIIDLSYGFHNMPNINNTIQLTSVNDKQINYINGYEFLCIQAAYQYEFWFRTSFDEVIDDYKLAMELYLNEKSKWIID